MAFNSPAGPPATARQLDRLLTLLRDAGHDGFRDARGPLGFTQRQGNGKFTRDEADALIERLEEPPAPADVVDRDPAAPDPPAVADPLFEGVDSERLADELRRRGWTVRLGPVRR